MINDLVPWLHEQLDADERRANNLDELGGWERDGIEATAGGHVVDYLDHFDASRMLAEVERTRKLIRRYELAAAASTALVPFTRGQDDGYRQACEDAIRDAAEVYAERPGYREEWRPEW